MVATQFVHRALWHSHKGKFATINMVGETLEDL
jgi:hypothetical protein